eukprot:s3534_g2.t2
MASATGDAAAYWLKLSILEKRTHISRHPPPGWRHPDAVDMPARPPVNMGMYDPTSERYRDPSKMQLVKTISKAEEEMSKTAREVELRLHSSGEILRLPAQVCTTVWDIKLFLADRLGRDPGDFTFIAKQGPFWRENKDCEEMRPKVVVKGLKSFERERMVHEHPIVVIGAGHIGLRQAMVFMKYKESNFVIFDRKEKVGGMAWWDQANVTSKLQTEYGVYHLGWDETIPTPTDDYPWPSRDELLKMFQKGAEEYGIIPYCRLGTEVKEVKAEGQKLDMKYEVVIEKIGSNKEETMKAAGVMMYPGNLSLPRRETYKGEEDFGGTIAYGMFDEFSYKEAQGKDIAIIGHGAFAVENVRSCCEYDSHQIYLICRRKNIACPRFVSWLCNQSLSPLSASLFLHAMKPMYDLVGYDVWDYYGVQGNASRTTCNIQQKARFGIGDVYFCAISWGKLGTPNRWSPLQIHVSLPSGRGETISVSRNGKVVDLKMVVQQSLGTRFLRLAAPDGHLLDPRDSLRLYHLKNGDSLAAVAQQPKLAATSGAFALWCVGGDRIVTWGNSDCGGDSWRVQDQLKNVQQIFGTSRAFAAVLADGSVVTWGNPGSGGDSSRVQDQLKNVRQICGTDKAFAAILADGSVVTWGDAHYGGDSSRVQGLLKNVGQICATPLAFAANLADGSVVTWGNAHYGGDSSRVQGLLKNVRQICATRLAFAAILADGSVVTWGEPGFGGDSSTWSAFAAILADGTVVTWGDPEDGGDSSRVQDQLKNAQQLCGTGSAFAAILADGSVVTWGDPGHGGGSSSVQDQLRNVQQICATGYAFAATLADGSVVTWGQPINGGDSSGVRHQLRNVQQICGTEGAFAAVLADGSVVTWGDPGYGGDSGEAQHEFYYV